MAERSGPLIFSIFAASHLGIAAMALTLSGTVPLAALAFALVELITFWDNFVIAIGNRLGIGRLAERLNRVRFFAHGTLISLLLPVYLVLGQQQGIAAFQWIWMEAIIAVLVASIAVLGYMTGYRNIATIIPTNYYGCLRYAQTVNDDTAIAGYDYSDEQRQRKAMPPLAAILTTVVNLGLALWIGLAAGFWLPFVATLLMFSAASFPAGRTGATLTSVIEVFYSAMLLYALILSTAIT